MYQLVIQFPLAQSMPYPDEFETLTALESHFMEFEGEGFKVDGHDMGSGEMNIFILTSNPRVAFKTIEPYLPSDREWRAGFRSVDSDLYEPLAPAGLGEFNVK
jgi:hypothetical protein